MTPPNAFFVTSGTMSPDAPSYVPRQADEELYASLSRGEFCYMLTSRQMGKSSLMVRTAERLKREDVAVASIDLTALGQNLTAEQWYDGLLSRLGSELGLENELEHFWPDHERLGPLQRWLAAIREVVLTREARRVVIFVDEIDYVRSLRFNGDEFFAAIRECYNRRAQEPAFKRLTFCLLGVATPSDLIQDPQTTPFNIGRRIELTDFSAKEATPLMQGLGREGKTAMALLQRILYWTGGHPYLTQRLGQAVAEDSSVQGTSGVDRLCEAFFLSQSAQAEDSNISFVRGRLLSNEADRASLLDLYRQIRRHKRVRDDQTSRVINQLRLAGVILVVEGYLYVRNRIYSRVFDRKWIKANMPGAELRRQHAAYRRGVMLTSGIAVVILAVMAIAILYANHQKQRADQSFQRALNDANSMVSKLADKLQPIPGTQSKTLERIFATAEDVYKELLRDLGDSTAVLESKARMLGAYTDIYLRLGNTKEALPRARKADEIIKQLAQQNPDNPERQHDLANSHQRIGDVLVAQGKRAQALEDYRASLAIREQLAQQNPGNPERQHDLANSHERIGDVRLPQGEQALEDYRASLAIREQLAQQNPDNPERQRNLANSHERIGDVLVAQGEWEPALQAHRASLAIREQLAQQEPGDAERQRDLANSHERIGRVLVAQGEWEPALQAHRASLAIRERLAQPDCDNPERQRDLASSHEGIGRVLVAQGEWEPALQAHRASLAIREQLTQQDSHNAEWQHDLASSHEGIGRVLEAQGKRGQALEDYRASLAIRERLAVQDPGNVEWQRDLCLALNGYAWTLLTVETVDLLDPVKALLPAEAVDLRDPVNALKVAQRAVQLSIHLSGVEQAMILDTLAMAHHLTEDHARAIAVAEQALVLVSPLIAGEREATLRQEIESHLDAFKAAQHARQKTAPTP
jgi:tetratricopeptide (TPR) repeat protein